MSDLEDGEIDNDSEPTESLMTGHKANYSMHEASSTTARPKLTPKYRSTAKHIRSSSESDSGGEEDSSLWRQKKEKYFRRYKDGTPPHCPSPTLPEFVPTAKPCSSSTSTNKKRNNIWGSVLTEQTLTHALVQDTGLNNHSFDKSERSVESYDFTNKYKDKRPYSDTPADDERRVESNDPFDSVLKSTMVKSRGREVIGYDDALLDNSRRNKGKRKMDCSDSKTGIHSRLGHKKMTTMQVGSTGISEDMEGPELAKSIAEFIHEAKVEIIERVVEHLGKKTAIRILNETRDVEDSGGMLTVDGSRRRTPGGVYLQLLKKQPEFNKEMFKLIFPEDHASRMEEKKRHKHRKQAKRKERKKAMAAAQSQSGSACHEETMEDGENQALNKPSKDRSAPELMECADKNQQESRSRKSRSSSHNGRRGDRVKSVDSRSGSAKPRSRRSRSYSDDDSEDSDDDVGKSRKTGEFDFQAELAAAKSLITKAKNDKSKEAEDDMDDLDEANVVDIPLDG